jgi:SAM-dependent methyltransferase
MEHFDFGTNWLDYSSSVLSEQLIAAARRDFFDLFAGVEFSDRTFLDIGFGQGLALCLASERGARAFGIDISPSSAEAAHKTMEKFSLSNMPSIRVGSILDPHMLAELLRQGPFDIVHSWGVLHHTGDMKQALINAKSLVKPKGRLVLALYTHHWTSPYWLVVKKLYNNSPSFLKTILISIFYPTLRLVWFFVGTRKLNEAPRGMNFYHDVIDWIGGYPYEYASIEEIKKIVGSAFKLEKIVPAIVPTGNNQFVFIRE